MTKYIDTDEANGKCAVERQLLKQAKIIKDLKWALSKMYDGVLKALCDTDIKETDKNYLRGSQECIETIRYIIYKGEHDENKEINKEY